MAKSSSSKEHRRCFFDITIDGEPAGRIVIELFDEIAPRSCENFARLCTGQEGVGKVSGKNLHYKGSTFHRVIRGFMIQGGDFTVGNGTGGESIYGGLFEDEEFVLKHDEPFMLSMANRGPDTNGSQFFITTNPAKHLDGLHIVFGKVISGTEIVTRIENLKVNEKKRPINDVIIANCGQLVRKHRHSLSDSDENTKSAKKSQHKRSKKKRARAASSGSEKAEKKKKKHSKAHKEEKGDAAAGGNDKKAAAEPESRLFSTVRTEDLPEVPAGGSSRFLRRRSPTPPPASSTKENKERKRDRSRRRDRSRSRSRDRRNANVRVFPSGHKVKGRGAVRYHADGGRFGRDKSATPPHWKREEKRLITLEELKKKKKEEEKLKEERNVNSTQFETFGFRRITNEEFYKVNNGNGFKDPYERNRSANISQRITRDVKKSDDAGEPMMAEWWKTTDASIPTDEEEVQQPTSDDKINDDKIVEDNNKEDDNIVENEVIDDERENVEKINEAMKADGDGNEIEIHEDEDLNVDGDDEEEEEDENENETGGGGVDEKANLMKDDKVEEEQIHRTNSSQLPSPPPAAKSPDESAEKDVEKSPYTYVSYAGPWRLALLYKMFFF